MTIPGWTRRALLALISMGISLLLLTIFDILNGMH